MPKSKPAAKSDRQVRFVVSVPVKKLEAFLRASDVTDVHPLTEADATKLLGDKEFCEILFDDLITFATEALENDPGFGGGGIDMYADVLNRLEVPHDGILEDEDRCEHGADPATCEICTFGDADLSESD